MCTVAPNLLREELLAQRSPLRASDCKYGDVSPVSRVAPRASGAFTHPTQRVPGGCPMPACPYTGSARGPWIPAADVSVILFASAGTKE